MQWVVENNDKITQGSIVSGVSWGNGDNDPPLSIVLSNACDFENNKLSYLTVAALIPAKETLEATKEYRSKVEGADESFAMKKSAWEKFIVYLQGFIHNKNISRYFLIDTKPTIDAPILLADFQRIMSIPADKAEELICEGQLDHPHVEKMISHFVSYMGRIPTDRSEGADEALQIEELRGNYHQKQNTNNR